MRILCTIIVTTLEIAGAWISGFDFNERGFLALFVYLVALIFAALTYFFPAWTDSK